MNKITYLQSQVAMEAHNLLCYSANLLMTRANPSHEQEWLEAKERLDIAKGLLNQEVSRQAEHYYSPAIAEAAYEMLGVREGASIEAILSQYSQNEVFDAFLKYEGLCNGYWLRAMIKEIYGVVLGKGVME